MTNKVKVANFEQTFASTRGGTPPVDLATAVLTGPAPDGGLWVPEIVEPFTEAELTALEDLTFPDLATEVAHRLLGNAIERGHLAELIRDALDFEIPLRALDPAGEHDLGFDARLLELYWGPTLAFKDVGARFMARVLRWARAQQSASRDLNILVATSGDTGSAVAHAFLGLQGFKVAVLFPKGQVSEAQRKLFTTLGDNTQSFSIDGTFDDCQRLVKQAFSDEPLRERMALGSANSINVARLLPQTLYYFWIRNQLSRADRRRPLIVSVPSGNFGNLTAGLLSQRLGLPIQHFVAATNRNDIVPQFLAGKPYTPRPSVSTVANAMDVGDPSNFERIQWLYGNDEDAIRRAVSGAHYTDAEITSTMRDLRERTGTLLDPHATVAYLGARDHARQSKANPPLVQPIYACLATAHPAKFAEVVRAATGEEIALPEALRLALGREESVTELEPDYLTFRAALEAS